MIYDAEGNITNSKKQFSVMKSDEESIAISTKH
jgi:hypothetical protein